MLTKHTDHKARSHFLFDDEHRAPAARYTIIFEGREDVVIAQPFESAAATWQRVLARLAENRTIIRHGAWRGREFHYVTIYSGIEPTETQRKEHMRDGINACLYQMADPARSKDAESRVQALIALNDLHGLNQPRTVYVVALPTLEQIEAEIAPARFNNDRGARYVEPAYWPQCDDRREPVLDPNYDPPRVIRYVGWRPCSCCGKKFFSRDVASIRLCGPCKDGTRRESW